MCDFNDVPLRTVAPEHASRASKITIDGIGRPQRSLSSITSCAIAAPEYPAPMITISALRGTELIAVVIDSLRATPPERRG